LTGEAHEARGALARPREASEGHVESRVDRALDAARAAGAAIDAVFTCETAGSGAAGGPSAITDGLICTGGLATNGPSPSRGSGKASATRSSGFARSAAASSPGDNDPNPPSSPGRGNASAIKGFVELSPVAAGATEATGSPRRTIEGATPSVIASRVTNDEACATPGSIVPNKKNAAQKRIKRPDASARQISGVPVRRSQARPLDAEASIAGIKKSVTRRHLRPRLRPL